MLCSKTSKEVHPRQYLTAFRPLEKGSYPVYNQYPKFIIDYKVSEQRMMCFINHWMCLLQYS